MAAAEATGVIPISSARAERTIQQRINAVMAEVKGVEKSGFNQHNKYAYAGHEAVTEAIRAAFVRHGIVQTASMLECDVLGEGVIKAKVRVTWACDDCPSSCVVSEMYAIQHAQTREKTVTAQQVGQALSYAVKNVAFKQLMLTGDTEPDSDSTEANDYRDEPARRRSEPPPAANQAATLAAEYLAKFGDCKTEEEIKLHSKFLRENWSKVQSVPGLSEQANKARAKAYERCKQAAERVPGQEG
jgi:hypothetical protein